MSSHSASSISQLGALLPAAQVPIVRWFLSRMASPATHPGDLGDEVISGWRSPAMARFAIEQNLSLARECELETIERRENAEVRCVLRDDRKRLREMLLSFESADSPRLASVCVRRLLPDDLEVRRPGPGDATELRRLELAAPIQRDDGTEVVIDHAGRLFDRWHVVRDHRWLAVFRGPRMVAVQAVALTNTSIGGRKCRIAYNHYSRSDPETRSGGNLMHLVATLYRDVYPSIDQFVSLVDVQNTSGLRLSFGSPWPVRVRRLFLPTATLAERRRGLVQRTAFDAVSAAAMLNETHEGMNLWVPRTPEFLLERRRRAPEVYDSACWRQTSHAVLALWPSHERRTYRRGSEAEVRTLALTLDYGFRGDRGRHDLTALLCEAAAELADQGISHLALFVSENHPRTEWLTELAGASDTYAIAAPVLASTPGPPTGPTYVDHVLF